MHIGLDFDNTIALYDRAFHGRALAAGLIGPEVPALKREVRDAIRLRPGGDRAWTELQGTVYGHAAEEAEPAPGVEDFLGACRARRVRVSIVSHKTAYPARGARVNLHDAARQWLERMEFERRFGIGPSDCAFAESLPEKLEEIRRRACTHFVDDLVEVLAGAGFPAGVERVLYGRGGEAVPSGITVLPTWGRIRVHLLDGPP